MAAELVQNNRSELERALNMDKTWLANQMNRKDVGFMTDGEHEDVTDPHSMLKGSDKAGIIVNALLRRVQLDPNDLGVFLRILGQKPQQFKAAIRILGGAGKS